MSDSDALYMPTRFFNLLAFTYVSFVGNKLRCNTNLVQVIVERLRR